MDVRAHRGRPRRQETDDRIIEAVLALIREHGPDAVNVAAVAERTALARTTIYRRYRDRRALLDAALPVITARGRPAAEAPVDDKLGWVLERTEEVLFHGIGPGGIAAVLEGTDPDFSASLRESLAQGLRPVTRQIEEDEASGLLVARVDADALVGVIIGACLAEALRHGVPPRPGWRERTVALLGALLRAT